MAETSESSAVTVRSTGIRYGVISGAISVVYFLVMTFADVDMSQGPGRWGGIIFGFILVFLAHKYYKDNGDGFMSYGQGIGIAFWLALISSAISSVFTYFYVRVIDASFIENILTKAREEMEAKGQSDDQINAAMKFVEMFSTPEMIFVFGLIGGVAITVIIGLLVSIFTQKKRAEATF